MGLKITLTDHVVEQPTLLGPVKKTLPQKQIWGQMDSHPKALLGYVGTQPNAPINIIVPDLPPELVEQIQDQVKSQLATVGDELSQRPSSDQMNELDSDLVDAEELAEDEANS